jgi:hypothetical protein
MEDPEIPTEHLHEAINEKAEEAKHKHEKAWSMYVAISTAIMAVFAAISGLMAGDHSNEALIMQIKSSDQWAYYQAKGIKAEIKAAQPNSTAEVAKYKQEQETIKKTAEDAASESAAHLAKHKILSKAVTFFQVAIAISAISILSQKKFLWYIGMALTTTGIVFFTMGLL